MNKHVAYLARNFARHSGIAVLALFLLVLSACLSSPSGGKTGSGVDVASGTGTTTAGASGASAASGSTTGSAQATGKSGSASGALADCNELLAKASEAEDNNHLNEAIRAYIGVIAIVSDSGADASLSGSEAKARLALDKIQNRLSLEAHESWLQADGRQKSGDIRSLQKEGALNPAVYLFENYGAGKAPVTDAPIVFEFVKNSGVCTMAVSTDQMGRANTQILKVDDRNKELILRAGLQYRVKGYVYTFKSIVRDFSYLPPAKNTLFVGWEKTDSGAKETSQSAEALQAPLRSLGLQVLPSSSLTEGMAFNDLFDGKSDATLAFCKKGGADYLALSRVEVDLVRQMELNGKKYNIFSAYAKGTFRLLRSDGTIVNSIETERLKADGGTQEKAVLAVLDLVRGELGKLVTDNQDLFKKGLSE